MVFRNLSLIRKQGEHRIQLANMKPVERQVEAANIGFTKLLDQFHGFPNWDHPRLMQYDWTIIYGILHKHGNPVQATSFRIVIDHYSVISIEPSGLVLNLSISDLWQSLNFFPEPQ